MAASASAAPDAPAAAIGGRLRLFGFILVVLGVLAMLSPLVAGVAVKYIIAALLFLGGIARIGWGIHAGSVGRGVIAVLAGVLMILGGIFLLTDPLMGLAAITLLIAWYFVAMGVTELIGAFRASGQGRGWLIFDGVVTLALGVLILSSWPVNALWVPGLLVGIHLFLTGIQLTALGRLATARS